MNVEAAAATSDDRFDSHFDGVVKEQLAAVNGYRSRTLRSMCKWWAILIPPWLALGFALTLVSWSGDSYKAVCWIWALVMLGCVAGPYWTAYEPYRKNFKDKLIGPLVRAYREGLTYSAEGGIDEVEFEDSGLFREHGVTDYEVEDLVEGRIGDTPFRFSEVEAKHVTKGKKSRTTKIFDGLFYVAEFNKHFAGSTYVFPDIAQRFLGGVGQALQSDKTRYGELVKLEDPEFERHFVVYSTSQVEARYILSSALMQRISALRARTGKKLRIGFNESHLYVAIATGKNHFEPRVFRAVHRELFREYWDVLDIFVAIVEELNLNTRIWTKE